MPNNKDFSEKAQKYQGQQLDYLLHQISQIGGGGGGDVFKVGTPVNNQIGIWTGDGTIEGSTNLTFDGTTLSATALDIDNILINGNTISSQDTDGDVNIVPDGFGFVNMTGGYVGIGTSNTLEGTLDIRGGSGTQGGKINFAKGSTGTGDLLYSIEVRDASFFIGGGTSGDILEYNSVNDILTLGNTASPVVVENTLRLKGYTVAGLPTGVQGDTAFVTDATAPTYLGTLTGGGAVICPVFHNGTAWVSH